MLSMRDPLQIQGHKQVEGKRAEKTCHSEDVSTKRAGVATLTSDKTASKAKTVTKDKEARFMMTEGQTIRKTKQR